MELNFARLKKLGCTLVNPWKEMKGWNHGSEMWSWAHQMREQIFQKVGIQGRLTKAQWPNFASVHRRRLVEK